MSFRLSLIGVTLLVCGGIFGVVKLQEQPAASAQLALLENGDTITESTTTSTRRRLQEQPGGRPTIYTYYEQSKEYNPNDDTMDLVENWRKSWYDMGKLPNKRSSLSVSH